jgi:small subunit ribosomal protein S13
MYLRIAGVNLIDRKHVCLALTGIYGIGRSKALAICAESNIDPHVVLGSLKEAEVNTIALVLKKYSIEGELKRETALNIKRLIDIKCYRGRRHRFCLPVRGQRTRSNASTSRKRRVKI